MGGGGQVGGAFGDHPQRHRRMRFHHNAQAATAWLRTLLHLYGDRPLPFDVLTAEVAGTLTDLARGRGHSPRFADIAIATTARRHELIILSRNTRHFAPMDVTVTDPFEALPPRQ